MKPTAFFNIPAAPITASVASPNILPTTGITVDTAAFVVFAVTPSTVEVIFPSKDSTVTNSVNIIPNIHIVDEFKNFDSLDIFISSDTLDIIFSIVDINIIGIIKFDIMFPIKLISNIKIGCTTPDDAIEPVASINVIRIGNSKLTKPTSVCILSFTKNIVSENVFIIIVIINMHSTKYAIFDTELLLSDSLIDCNILFIIIIINIIPNIIYCCFKLSSKYI